MWADVEPVLLRAVSTSCTVAKLVKPDRADALSWYMGALFGDVFCYDIQSVMPDGCPTLHLAERISLRWTPKEGWLYGCHRGRTPRCGNGLARKTLVQRSGKDLSTSRRGGLNEGLKVRFET